ncbi:MAG: DUF1436 family protein [Chitinophagaceae bacterium]|nr:MAG: DUF1436 family protein [Chitinophagaceae bacterium]
MQIASVYKLVNKGYLIFGTARTISGFRIGVEPYIRIAETEINIDNITNAIKTSLKCSATEKIPDPKNWKEDDKIFLKKAGLKSLKELNKHSTKTINIKKEGDNIIFIPTRHAEKPDEGFLHKGEDEKVIIPSTASNQEILAAFVLAFDRCE